MRILDFMSTPVGRAIRVAVGLVMIVAGATVGGAWWALAAGGLLPLATGVFGVCPISPLVGRSWRGNACRTRT
jgi:Inner membrane protein YgaP-like, transmembrane domain